MQEKPWSNKELQYLSNNWGNTYEETKNIVDKLNRPYADVRCKAGELGFRITTKHLTPRELNVFMGTALVNMNKETRQNPYTNLKNNGWYRGV